MASTIPAAFLGLEPRGTVTADWDPAGCNLSVKTVTTTEQDADIQ
jgi:hypothetical protein